MKKKMFSMQKPFLILDHSFSNKKKNIESPCGDPSLTRAVGPITQLSPGTINVTFRETINHMGFEK